GRRALHILGFTLWHHRRLRAALALNVALGLSTFVVIWLIQPYMQARGIPTAWFGPLWAGAHIWLAAVSLASGRVAAALGARESLLGCCLLVLVGYAGLALSHVAWGLAFYLCFMTIRGLQAPILANVMQQDAPAELQRAVARPPAGLHGRPRAQDRSARRRRGAAAQAARRAVPSRDAQLQQGIGSARFQASQRQGAVSASRAAGRCGGRELRGGRDGPSGSRVGGAVRREPSARLRQRDRLRTDGTISG